MNTHRGFIAFAHKYRMAQLAKLIARLPRFLHKVTSPSNDN